MIIVLNSLLAIVDEPNTVCDAIEQFGYYQHRLKKAYALSCYQLGTIM